jgi:hypothetical protein
LAGRENLILVPMNIGLERSVTAAVGMGVAGKPLFMKNA